MMQKEKIFPISVPGTIGVRKPDGTLVVRDKSTGAESELNDAQVSAELVAIGKGHLTDYPKYNQRQILGLHAQCGPHTVTMPAKVYSDDCNALDSAPSLTAEEQAAADAGEKQGRELADQLLAQREAVNSTLQQTALGRKFLASRADDTEEAAAINATLERTALGRKFLASQNQH